MLEQRVHARDLAVPGDREVGFGAAADRSGFVRRRSIEEPQQARLVAKREERLADPLRRKQHLELRCRQ